MATHEYRRIDLTTGQPLDEIKVFDPIEEVIPNDFVVNWDENNLYLNPVYDFEEGVWVEGEIVGEVLEVYKMQKIEVINTICNEAIVEGFTSPTLGFDFEFESHDQDNFTQQAIILMSDTTITTVSWKTKNQGIQSITRDQFFTLLKESENHKRNQIGKYWQLKATIELAQTKAEVDAINW